MRGGFCLCMLPLLWAGVLWGAEPEKATREAFGDMLYSTGETFVPSPGHRDAVKGHIFRFDRANDEAKAFGVLPHPPKELEKDNERQAAWILKTMQREKTGDVFYMGGDKEKKIPPTMVIVSGKVRDLGLHYLYEFNGKKLAGPEEWPAVDVKKGVLAPGWIREPEAGHVYLIETVDSAQALFRIIARGEGGMQIQWVAPGQRMTTEWYIAGGMTSVAENVDVSLRLPDTRPATRVAVAVVSPTTREVRTNDPPRTAPGTLGAIAWEPIRPKTADTQAPIAGPDRVAALLHERDGLIRMRLTTVGRDALSPRERMLKVQAMVELGQLQAVEAVEPLLAQITYMDPGAPIVEDLHKAHPAVGALIQVGKPAAAAALKAMGQLKAVTRPGDTAQYRTTLLCIVLRAVEGDEVTEFLLKRESEKADAEHKAYFEQALRELKTAP